MTPKRQSSCCCDAPATCNGRSRPVPTAASSVAVDALGGMIDPLAVRSILTHARRVLRASCHTPVRVLSVRLQVLQTRSSAGWVATLSPAAVLAAGGGGVTVKLENLSRTGVRATTIFAMMVPRARGRSSQPSTPARPRKTTGREQQGSAGSAMRTPESAAAARM